MTKAKLAIVFTVVILISLGYCGLGGQDGTWTVLAAGSFLLSLGGLVVIGFFALFDWMSRRKQ